MAEAGDFDFKVLIKATRANNAQAGAPASVCDQEVLTSRADLRSRVEDAVARAIPPAAKNQGAARVKALIRVIRRADGRKEDLKQICTVEELPAIAASLASDCATAVAGDPLAPSPTSLIAGAKDFARDAHAELRAAAAWIAPLAKTPAAAAAPGVTEAAAPVVAEAVKTARKTARAARAAGAAPPTPEGMLQNVLTGVFKNIMKNPETMRSVMETGQKIAAGLPPPPIKPV